MATTGKVKKNVMTSGLVAGGAAWCIAGLVEGTVGGGGLFRGLFVPAPAELLVRITVSALFVAFSLYVRKGLTACHESEESSCALAKAVMNGVEDAISIVDTRDLRILGANSAFLGKVGLTEAEVTGQPCHAVTHRRSEPCTLPEEPCPLSETVATGRHAVAEHIHVNPDGTQRYEEVATSPLFDVDGHVTRVVHVARDATRRRLAEEELRASEVALRLIFNSVRDAIVVHGANGRIVDANERALELYGVGREEVPGLSFAADLSASGTPVHLLEQHWHSALAGDAPFFEWEGRRPKDGGSFPAEILLQRITLGNGHLVMANIRDVTGRKEAEAALRRSEVRLARAQKIAHLGSWEWDVSADTISWSDEMALICGFEAGGAPPDYERFLDLIHPADRECFNRAVNEALYNRGRFSLEYRIVLPGGWIKCLRGQGEVTCGDDGAPLRMFGTALDITNIKEAELALGLSREKFAKAFHASPDWIVISRAGDGCYLEVNDAFLRITGYTRDEVIGRTSVDLGIWVDPEERLRMLRLIEQYGMLRNQEVEFRMKSGDVRLLLWSAEIIDHGGEACVIAVARDVTEIRQLENELRESQMKLLQKHDELKRLFARVESIKKEWEMTVDCLGDMILLAGGDGKVKRCNRTLRDFLGLPYGEIIGAEWVSLLRAHGLIGEPGEVADRELHHEGSGRRFVLTPYPLRSPGGGEISGCVVTIRDVTDLTIISEELERLKGRADDREPVRGAA